MADIDEKESNKKEIISQGIQTLIERLKSEGVAAGKNEAETLIKEAQSKAEKILNKARKEAEKMLEDAHQNIQKEKQTTEDALKIAARDMRLELRQLFINRFKEEVKRLLHKELTNEETIRQLILLLTIDTAEQLQSFKKNQIEIELPEKILDFESIRKNPKLLENDPLKQLAQGVTSQMLHNGINLVVRVDNQHSVGIKIKIVNENIEMDLTEEAIGELLLKHIQPRFRALLEGLLQ